MKKIHDFTAAAAELLDRPGVKFIGFMTINALASLCAGRICNRLLPDLNPDTAFALKLTVAGSVSVVISCAYVHRLFR